MRHLPVSYDGSAGTHADGRRSGSVQTGQKCHSPTMAKHATMSDYRRATGFEALIGYLYLKEDFTRMTELVHAGLTAQELAIKEKRKK